jgi:hypothetical protein
MYAEKIFPKDSLLVFFIKNKFYFSLSKWPKHVNVLTMRQGFFDPRFIFFIGRWHIILIETNGYQSPHNFCNRAFKKIGGQQFLLPHRSSILDPPN